MKHSRKFWLVRPVHFVLLGLCLLLCIPLYFIRPVVFLIGFPVVLAVVAACAYRLWRIQKDLYQMVTDMGRSMTDSSEASLINFPLSSLLVNDVGEIVWYNEMFRERVLRKQEDIFGSDLRQVMKAEITDLLLNQGMLLCYQDRYYEAYCLKTTSHGRPFYSVYLVDITELQVIKLQSARQRPVVMLLLIDNYEESIGNENEGNKAKLLNEVRTLIQKFVDNTTGFLRKLEHDRYLIVMEQWGLDEIVKNRFNILDQVRELPTENRIPVTLSIGVARLEETFGKAEQEARQALDMALGRGGDQAALKADDGYEFFGGYSKGVEKRTKVKTRIVASAMVELIKAASNVLIMGHRFADLDALGSGIGMAKACECLGKPTNIVLDTQRNLADALVKRLVAENRQEVLCLPETALDLITEKTLLIIVDTHMEALLEARRSMKDVSRLL